MKQLVFISRHTQILDRQWLMRISFSFFFSPGKRIRNSYIQYFLSLFNVFASSIWLVWTIEKMKVKKALS